MESLLLPIILKLTIEVKHVGGYMESLLLPISLDPFGWIRKHQSVKLLE